MSLRSVKIGGKTERLDKQLGKGGEGDVYALVGQGDCAVKIYKSELRSSRENKVRAMIDGRLAGATTLVAFPSEVVTDSSGNFLGFTMRLVAGYRALHELYSPKSRKMHFPKADYRFLVRVAQNVARAVATVHQAGCIIGDLNHSGVLVGPDATVALIDADSFQFSLKGHAYPCVVGTEDFTPPELHGGSLAKVTRTQAHDNFGLAVAIFQLLAMGKHPYAGRYNGPDLSLGQSIAQNRFAFSMARRNETRTTPPPGSVLLADFPGSIAAAFEAAFGLAPSSRPDPAIWVSLLQGLETGLRRCADVPTHYFPGSATSCLWCRLASQSGIEMFPQSLVVGSVPLAGSFDLERVWAAIRALRLPMPDEVLPIWTGTVAAPSVAVTQAKGKRHDPAIFGGIALLFAIIGCVLAPKAALLWGGLGLFGLVRMFATNKVDSTPFRKAYQDADGKVRLASQAYLQRIGLREMHILRADLEDTVIRYRQVQEGLAQALNQLKLTREERQRAVFLDRFLIRRASIPGIGAGKTATLASFGIESAADITASAVRAVPGFGEALTAKMLAWRQGHEGKFRYNATPDPSDLQAEQSTRVAFATKQIELQRKIQSGLAALQAATPRCLAAKNAPDQVLTQALQERAIAEHDCVALGISVPAPVAVSIDIPKRTQTQPSRAHPTPVITRSSVSTTTSSSAMNSCPSCGASMVRRTARKGKHTGRQFWGCSKFPACKGTRS
ncbi:topoisomerase DNA-binding C4 zinc finger domain-containing protein [Pseudomonas sp. CHM02]|uniref:protein kinase domain-containing protein n=1 Tax=Pseudomonas sp. CHM02 TaxID=1463662 RepID=UPI000472D02D|nr:topoisomerase DNA-binding C4 zinc finger domain-containing protein [Pseudomonas sp. CHM02]